MLKMVVGIYENQWRFNDFKALIQREQFDDLKIVRLDHVDHLQNVDLLFVNIDMLNNAKEIEFLLNHREEIKVIFILETVAHLQKLLEEQFYDIISYPINEQLIIDHVRKTYSAFKSNLTLKFGGGKNNRKSIPYDSIYYINSNKRVIEVMGLDATEPLGVMYCKLDDVEKLLPNTFIRCHKSYIVNSTKIKRKTSKYIYLENIKNPISISRARKGNVL